MTRGIRSLMRLTVLPSLLLLATGCAGISGGDSESWRPLRAGSPLYSLESVRPAAAFVGSRLTVPRITGAPGLGAPLEEEEEGDIWPGRNPPRVLLTDPQALTTPLPPIGGPRRPTGSPGELYESSPSGPPRQAVPRPGEAVHLPDGRTAIGGAGGAGAGSYTVPGQAGVGTALPDGQGGLIFLEPGGRVLQAPR